MTKNLDYKKVLVGVSGGVDSSVCIDLLKKQGLEVEGVVIRFSPESDEAVNDAKKVCDKLGIPLHVADAQADFMKYVVTPFCENYVSGKTPNPCIVCNPHVKFATLIKTADQLGIGKGILQGQIGHDLSLVHEKLRIILSLQGIGGHGSFHKCESIKRIRKIDIEQFRVLTATEMIALF